MTITRKARNRALTFSAVGVYAVSLMIGCSSDPSAPGTIARAGSPGAAGASAGSPGAAGTPAAGAPAAGAPSAGADTGGSGGAPAAGSGGDAAGAAPTAGAFVQPDYVTVTFSVDNIQWVADAGTAGAGAGGAGGSGGAAAGGSGGAAAGAGGAAAGPFCSQPGVNTATLPYVATKSFIPSDYQPNGGGNQISNLMGGCTHYDATACGTGNANDGKCGLCMQYTYTPDKTAATYAGVGYVRKWDANKTADPICIPETAKAVTFYAKGAVGGEKVTFTAQGAVEVPLTLTATWTKYSIPLTPGTFNTAETGVEQGFFWKVDPYIAP